MQQATTVELITAAGTIITPILVLILTGMGWMIQRRLEQTREQQKLIHDQEQLLREDRLQIYDQILEPFIIVLTKDQAFATDEHLKGKNKNDLAQEKMLSLEYRRAAFKLSLMADDNVFRAYNELMKYFFNQNGQPSTPKNPFKVFELFGDFLLQIRKSVGNQNTSLKNMEMLEWLITDIRKYDVMKNPPKS